MYNNPKYKYQFYAPEDQSEIISGYPLTPLTPPVVEEETNNNNNTQKPKKKNLITALKKLLAAFGGEETQSNNAVEIVDKIADSVEQGGGGSGGGGVFLVTATSFDSGGTLNKTYSEIAEAMLSGKNVIIKFDEDDMGGGTTRILPVGEAANIIDSKTGFVTCRIICYMRLQGAVSAVVFSSNSPDGTLTIN